MAKTKSKTKFSYQDGKERGRGSLSEYSSTESEKSQLTVNADGFRHNSEILKRQRHYQEFKRLYYSRLQSKERRDKKGHDTEEKWNDAVGTVVRKESSDKIPLRMTSSKVSHRRSEKSYIDKIVKKYQKVPTSKKTSCESVKLMYSAYSEVGEDRRKHSHDKHGEREYEKEKDKIRRRKDNVNEIQRKHEESLRDKYRRSNRDEDIDEKEEYYRQYRKQHRHSVDDEEQELPLEEEYYRKYHRHHEKDKNSEGSSRHKERSKRRHSVEYDDDEYDRRRKIYENYQKYVRRHSAERDYRHRSHENYDNNVTHRHRSHEKENPYKSDHTDKLKKYDNHDKYMYKYEKDRRRYNSPDERMQEDQHYCGHRHRSKSCKSSKYGEDDDYDIIERLEKYIMEKRIGNTMLRHHEMRHHQNREDENCKYYLYSHRNVGRMTSTGNLPEKVDREIFEKFDQNTSSQEKDFVEEPTLEKSTSKEIQCEEDDGDIPVKPISSNEEQPEKDGNNEAVEPTEIKVKSNNSEKLLIEQEIQCIEVEKKSQAIEANRPSIISSKPTRQKSNLKREKKAAKSGGINTKSKNLIVNTNFQNNCKLQCNPKSTDTITKCSTPVEYKNNNLNQKEHSTALSIKDPKKCTENVPNDPNKSVSVLSTISQMEERAIKTLEALKDAEKIIINEKLGEIPPLSHAIVVQKEIERHLKEIQEITKKNHSKQHDSLIKRNKHINKINVNKENVNAKQLALPKITSYHQQYQQELQFKLLVLKLEELEREQNQRKKSVNKIEEKVILNKALEKKKTLKFQEKNSTQKESQKINTLTGIEALKLYLTSNLIRDIDKISPNASDRYGKLKFHDVEGYLEDLKKNDVKNFGRNSQNVDVKEKVDSDWLDVRKEDIIVYQGLNCGTDSSENNLNWTSDDNIEYQECCTKIKVDHNDTIQEEDVANVTGLNTTNSPNVKEQKDEIIPEINDEKNLETSRMKLLEEIRKAIDEPISMLKSGSALKTCFLSRAQQIGSAPTLLVSSDNSTSKDNLSKSKLPIRVDYKFKKIDDVTESNHETESNPNKSGSIYRRSRYDKEELIEKLIRLIDYEKALSRHASFGGNILDLKTNKQTPLQKVKNLFKNDKKKNNKKLTKTPSPPPKSGIKIQSKTQNYPKTPSNEETLIQAITLFNIHKSTLSMVQGEMNQLEQKIDMLLANRESPKLTKSKIPRRVF